MSVLKSSRTPRRASAQNTGAWSLQLEEMHIRDPRRKLQDGAGELSLKQALPQLHAYAKSTTERTRGGVGTGEHWTRRGWGEQEKRREEEKGQAEGGRTGAGVVKKQSKGEVVDREGDSTQTATLLQHHWQLYFKGNSQNCDIVLYNGRVSILFLDTMPKMTNVQFY